MNALFTDDAVVVRSFLGPRDERSLAEDVLDGLTRPFKELPPKHFYDACSLRPIPTRSSCPRSRSRRGSSGSQSGAA